MTYGLPVPKAFCVAASLCDAPAQSLGAVPLMAVLTLIGSAMSFLFLSRLAVPRTAAEVGRRREAARPVHYPPAPRPRRPMWY